MTIRTAHQQVLRLFNDDCSDWVIARHADSLVGNTWENESPLIHLG